MATISKFYLHDASSPNTGTLPSGALLGNGLAVGDVTGDATGARTARDATDTIGTANPDTESAITSNADVNPQTWGHRRFVSRPLAAQTIPFTTSWTFSYARTESNLNHNQQILGAIYVWRPSDGTRVGTGAVVIGGTEPTSAGAEEAESVSDQAGPDQAILDGDILVFDITTAFTQAMNTAYTEQFAYDGTTEANTTSCATFVTPPSALQLFAAPDSATTTFHPIPFMGGH